MKKNRIIHQFFSYIVPTEHYYIHLHRLQDGFWVPCNWRRISIPKNWCSKSFEIHHETRLFLVGNRNCVLRLHSVLHYWRKVNSFLSGLNRLLVIAILCITYLIRSTKCTLIFLILQSIEIRIHKLNYFKNIGNSLDLAVIGVGINTWKYLHRFKYCFLKQL